jgi:4-hydroxybenzoate polyprenyltransferase
MMSQSRSRAMIRELRPRQWTKNLIVYAALVFSRDAGDLHKIGRASVAVFVFCLLSGAIYLLNDIVDIERDRHHPLKRLRPLAAGLVTVRAAALTAAALTVVAFAAAAVLGWSMLIVAAAFVVLQLAYNYVLKRLVIIDAMAISAGFVLRVVGGVVAIHAVASPWIILCTGLLAMFLGLVKRRSELADEEVPEAHRPALAHYTEQFLDSMISSLSAATIVSYSMYTFLSHERREPSFMMVTIPFVAYGLFRYLYLVHRRGLGSNPEEILVSDVPLMIDIVLFAVVSMLVLGFE